ncbi:MAG: MFS transporter [Gemmatimonadaceae bacterium]
MDDRHTIQLKSPQGRWTVAAAVLGSGAVFLEGTVVNVALPTIGGEFALGMSGLQWIMNGYLLTLSALMLLGGSLGDVYRRRKVFVIGLVAFTVMSALCSMAPNVEVLVALRLLQGAAGALLVPNSLAILDTVFTDEDRAGAIGQWAGWSAVSTALGPLAGGWLVEAASWRWVFASVTPFAIAAAWIAWRHVPDVRTTESGSRSIDYLGAALVTAGLGGVIGALMSGPNDGFTHPAIMSAGLVGVVLLAAFVVVERRSADPLLPLVLFRSRQFSGTNATTLLVYAALSGLFFFLVLQLQNVVGYSALETGAALLPVNIIMLALSPAAGRLGQRIGPRLPMTVGALLAAGGMLLLSRVSSDAAYLTGVLPGLAVFGLGLSALVAPLTAAVLGAVDDEQVGIASAVNNAVARLAGLLAVAIIPLAAGLGGLDDIDGPAFAAGYTRAMLISAALCAMGSAIAFITVRKAARAEPLVHPDPSHACTGRRPAHAHADGGSGRPG